MRSVLVGTMLSVTLAAEASAQVSDVCAKIAGAMIVADDGTFLGRVASAYNAESVLNEYGRHGSEFASASIWNQYGRYGGEFARLSPFNRFTHTPPMLVVGGKVIASLTVNTSVANAVNPYVLKACGGALDVGMPVAAPAPTTPPGMSLPPFTHTDTTRGPEPRWVLAGQNPSITLELDRTSIRRLPDGRFRLSVRYSLPQGQTLPGNTGFFDKRFYSSVGEWMVQCDPPRYRVARATLYGKKGDVLREYGEQDENNEPCADADRGTPGLDLVREVCRREKQSPPAP